MFYSYIFYIKCNIRESLENMYVRILKLIDIDKTYKISVTYPETERYILVI